MRSLIVAVLIAYCGSQTAMSFASNTVMENLYAQWADNLSQKSADELRPFLRPLAVGGGAHPSLSSSSSVLERVSKILPPRAVHMAATDEKVTISGRYVARSKANGDNEDSITFDQSQMWFNVSFTGPGILYATLEFMCLNGGQTPNVFRGYTADGSDPNSHLHPQLVMFDTEYLQITNVSNGVGPFCGQPITIPMSYTQSDARPTNFSIFKDTEPNFNFGAENFAILYGFSLVGIESETNDKTIDAVEKPPHIHLHKVGAKTQKNTPPPSPLAFHNAPYSVGHLKALQTDLSAIDCPFRRRQMLKHHNLLQAAPSALPRRRRIEWLGDSVTVGYGNLCHSENAPINNYTVESGWYAWPTPTCAFFGAECNVEGWSGKGLIRNCCGSPPPAMNEYYLRSVMSSPRSEWAWNFSSWIPDAVVMRLGTNDFANTDDGPEFMKNYTDGVVKFFTDAFTNYGPQVQVFVACGPSRTDYCEGLSDAMRIVRQPDFPIKAAATNTHFIDLRQVYYDNGNGDTNVCFGHPDPNAAYVLATRAIGAISAVMNWNEWDN